MIRPVSYQQMQRVGKPPLQSPRQSRVNALLQPSSPLKQSTKTFSKSPIKKHLQNASAFVSETFFIGATTASDEDLAGASSSSLHGPLKAKLRASVLQAVLRLLDQDVNALSGAHEVLQAAAALPLAEPSVQRACVQALRGLQESGPVSPQKQTMQAAQQTKSSGRLTANSLRHCKEFLLACANEIHELEDDRPVEFDYAEDTTSCSSLAQRTASQFEKMCKHCGAANFDYASTVQESSSAYSESDDSDDDTRAAQGSQFSDVLHRAEYMSDVDCDDEVESSSRIKSMSDRVVCRQVLQALHEHVQSQRATQHRRSSAPNLAMKFRAFEALKLQASYTRKRLAFQRLKTGLRSRHQQSPTALNTLVKAQRSSPVDMTFQTLMVHHSDVLMLLLALVFLANLPAKYIM